tara:strand:+ start:670 stop:879 length:210 start_codon:yes stop_codon:yes gene_type:complete
MITARAYIDQADQVLVLRNTGTKITVTCAGLVLYFESEDHLANWQEAIDVGRHDLLHPDDPNPYKDDPE